MMCTRRSASPAPSVATETSYDCDTLNRILPGSVRHDGQMTVIKINAITVPADSGDELAHRFAARAGAVDNADGFEGFELLKPTDGREQWLVLTRWRDEESFQAWLNSDSFAHGPVVRPR